MRLSQDSIQQARDKVNSFAEMIRAKLPEFVEELAEIGIKVINVNVQNALGADDKNVDVQTELQQGQDKATMIIRVSGKDILFIEYGAGVHYNGHPNSSPHPLGVQKGYTIGSYSEKHLGLNDSWFYRKGGELFRSYGTMATMPVYKAYTTMTEKVSEVAKKVFV